MMKKRLRTVVGACACIAALALAGCQTQANTKLYRIDPDTGATIHGMWKDMGTDEDFIKRGDETFGLIFREAFFKTLPDIGTTNEVIIAFEFIEGPAKDDKNSLVKIIGPMIGIPDGQYALENGPIVYGPKTMDADELMVRITIFELDDFERTDRDAWIKFIGGIAQQFAIADPVTATEIALAQEILRTLNSLDQNDQVMKYEFHLQPEYAGVRRNGSIPFKAGDYAIIQQEAARPLQRYFHFTQKVYGDRERDNGDWFTWIATVPADILTLPFVILSRSFLDVPSGDAMAPLRANGKDGAIFERGRRICFEDSTSRLRIEDLRLRGDNVFRDYESKTYLTFSIEEGGDGTDWAKRKLVLEADRKMYEGLKPRRVGDILAESGILDAIKALQAARRLEAIRQGRIAFKEDVNYAYTAASNGNDTPTLVLRHRNGTKIEKAYYENAQHNEQTPPPRLTATNTGSDFGDEEIVYTRAALPASDDASTTVTVGAYTLYLRTRKIPDKPSDLTALKFHVLDKASMTTATYSGPARNSWVVPTGGGAPPEIKIPSWGKDQTVDLEGTNLSDHVAGVIAVYENGKERIFRPGGKNTFTAQKITLTHEGDVPLKNVSNLKLKMKHGLGDIPWRK